MKKLILALGVVALSAPAAIADEALIAKGETEFRTCGTCHRIEGPDGLIGKWRLKTGPNLYGVAGRTAGSLDTYARSNGKTKYGKSLVAAGEKGLVWNSETFSAYIVDPKGYLTEYLGERAIAKMAAQKRADGPAIYAYLASLAPAAEAAAEPAEEPEAEAATN